MFLSGGGLGYFSIYACSVGGGGVGEVVGSGLLAGLCKSKVDRMTSLFTSILV